ncbi:MAG: right-handed parallel beta-helix repeat-containing protein [Candidatus Bathyarchaeota archaeon]|nr:MAG: right-handed parallel beta-helix repeat-containing protein [Candidatus Bathyarchaeota archaeon]
MKLEAAPRIALVLLVISSISAMVLNVADTADEQAVHNVDTNLYYEAIQDAIDAPETLDGHTIQIDAEVYYEHLTVDKSLKLIGEERSTSIIDGGGSGTVINILASNVSVSGLTLRNSGPDFNDQGVSLDHSINAIIVGNIIADNAWGIWLENAVDALIGGNAIENNTLGALYLGNSTGNDISRNTIRNNEYGVWLERSSENNYISHNFIVENWKGIYLAKTANSNVVENNTITDNDDGIYLSSSLNSIRENTVVDNLFGIYSLHSGGNIIYHNNFISNVIKQASFNESYVDFWDNGHEGNHWSSYNGEDLDGDGVGDTDLPHQGLDWHPLMEPWSKMRVFSVIINEETYHVTTLSNSTIAGFNFSSSAKQVSFNVTGPSGARGFCNVTVPKSLLRDSWLILVDGADSTASTIITETDAHTFFYLSYDFSTHRVRIIGSEVSDISPPVADAGEDRIVDEDASVTLDGSGSHDNIGITSYTWSFTDETQQVLLGVSPTYTFTNPSSYIILLNVSDGAGHHATDMIEITVLDVTNPVANAGSDRTIRVDTEVVFNAGGSSDNVGIASFEWDFGDGYDGTGITANHTYTEIGAYTVELTVKDAAGNSATDSITVTVESADDMNDSILIIGGLIGIFVIVAYMIRRRKASFTQSEHD